MATKKAVSKSSTTSVKKPSSTAKTTVKTSTVKAVSATRRSNFFTNSPLARAPFIGSFVAELIGTFLFAGAVIAGQGQPIIILFAIAGIVLLVGGISGAHLNPAITIAALVTRKISALRALGYVVAQFLGAALAFALLSTYVNGAGPVSAEAQAYGQAAATLFQATALPAGKEWYIFFAELIGASIFGLVMASAVRIRRDRVARALTVGLGLFVALLLTASAAAYVGGSSILNPAVALSLQSLKWELWPITVYILAPVIGAIIGFFVHDIIRVDTDSNE